MDAEGQDPAAYPGAPGASVHLHRGRGRRRERRRAPEDPEIKAMRVCSAELEGLRESDDEYALSRVLGYLNRRFGG